MKSLLFSLCLLTSALALAQVDIEEGMDNIPMIENTSSAVVYNVRGIYQVSDNNCNASQFKSLVYPGGSADYIKDLKEKLQQNVNWNTYVINGLFFVKLDINKNGVLTNAEAGPKVANGDLFLKDLKNAAMKANKIWKPATCNGNAVDSKAILKIDFSSMTYDNAFN